MIQKCVAECPLSHGPASDPPERGIADNLANPGDYRPLLRALLESLDRWVRDGVEPPVGSTDYLQQYDTYLQESDARPEAYGSVDEAASGLETSQGVVRRAMKEGPGPDAKRVQLEGVLHLLTGNLQNHKGVLINVKAGHLAHRAGDVHRGLDALAFEQLGDHGVARAHLQPLCEARREQHPARRGPHGGAGHRSGAVRSRA